MRANRSIIPAPAPRFESGPVDPILVGAVLMLMGFGLVMIYSAGVHAATVKHGNHAHFLMRSGVHAIIGLIAMWTVSHVPYELLRRLVIPIILGAVAAMVLVLVLGHTAGRARRWFDLGLVMFQPSELAKVALVVYLAHVAQSKSSEINSLWRGYVPPLLVAGALMLTSLLQPDFGTAVIFGAVAVIMLFVAGTRLWYVMLTLLMGAGGLMWLIDGNAMRRARFLAFLSPFEHRYDVGYQTVNGLAALASGGWTGQGLGQSQQKIGFIPEAHTDFIVPVIGEELGLVGIVAVLTIYSIIAARGLRAARGVPDGFGQALGFGIVTVLMVQVAINMGVSYALLPTKGLTLPLASYGGTSMLMSCISIGILLQLSRRRLEPLASGRGALSNPGALPLELSRGTP